MIEPPNQNANGCFLMCILLVIAGIMGFGVIAGRVIEWITR